MRVGINATSLDDRPSGARQRFVGLYGALFRANPGVDFLIYEPRDCAVAGWFADLPNVSGIATPLPATGRWPRFLRGLGYWRRRLARDRLDLFETLHLPLIRAPHCPTLMTVHDARVVGHDIPPLRRALYRHVLRQSLRRADRVVTVSDTMRDELLALEPAASVETIYNGIDPSPFAGAHAADPAIGAPFLLAVGHFEPRKNYAALLAAMELVAKDAPDLHLVIVGKDGGTLAAITAEAGRPALGDRVHLLHRVDDAMLAALYREAVMLVFPSTYEGFGIPVLEAMAAGTPMALAALPVFRELTQDQAAYFDPADPAAMAATILALASDEQARNAQRAYGAARIADFAFPALAAQLGQIHRLLAPRAAAASDARRNESPR